MNNSIADKKQIIMLWQEAFGDPEDEIAFFIDNVKNARVCSYIENGRLISMFYLVKCIVNEREGEYLYAACTAKSHRGMGYFTKLLDKAAKNGIGFICLIPANEKLVEFYNERGFLKSVSVSDLRFDQTDEIEEYLFEGCELEKPVVLIKELKG